MSLQHVATETLGFLEAGGYTSSTGDWIDLADAQRSAEEGTKLWKPEQLEALKRAGNQASSHPTIAVTDETTQIAARRLVVQEGHSIVLLNFASARNAGGGFLRGDKAQEEDVCRCSGLQPCLAGVPEYFRLNRASGSRLYTDHMIYSPNVPFFRTRSSNLLDHSFLASVITAPAPNAGEHLERHPDGLRDVEETAQRRCRYVLELAAHEGHRTLLLGAWGCGIFQVPREIMANAFRDALDRPNLLGAFDHITFAIPAKGTRSLANFETFRDVFGSSTSH